MKLFEKGEVKKKKFKTKQNRISSSKGLHFPCYSRDCVCVQYPPLTCDRRNKATTELMAGGLSCKIQQKENIQTCNAVAGLHTYFIFRGSCMTPYPISIFSFFFGGGNLEKLRDNPSG